MIDKRAVIEKVLEGNTFRRKGSLSFSCPKVEISLKAGESAEGSFTVTGGEGLPLLGIVRTGDIRMKCLTQEFTGSPATIRFSFDSMGLDEGEKARGEFKIISSQGEYTLPYMARVAPKVFETSLGQIKNLFHFANLAKTNWQEAVKVFYSSDFIRILSGNDRQYINVYRALSMPPRSGQRVEEFLIRIRKKQKVEYIADTDSMVLTPSEEITRETVTLLRNGWGYTKLHVGTEGGFLRAEKELLTDDDFLGNKCSCGILILRSGLHAGYNYGKIRFYNEYVSLEIPVRVNAAVRPTERRKREAKRNMLEFYQYYLRYSMGKLSRQEWLSRTEGIIEGMAEGRRGAPVRELFKAHILLTRQRYNEAKWVLDQAANLIIPGETKQAIRCYYLYLPTLASEDEAYIREVTEEIRGVYLTDETSWEIAWLLLYLDEECSRSMSRKWSFLEQQFEKGCHSPVWYLEAAMLVMEKPEFLMKMSPFAMQTLNFMAKYDYLTDECIAQIHYLASRLKWYSGRMFYILQVCYHKKKDIESLRAICALLIKGNKIGQKYAGWYREAIEREIWLTRLYECYALSVDMGQEEEIPVSALRYFSYRSTLPYERTAWLYACIIRRKEKYPELYRTCLPEMERFLLKQMEKGRVNGDLAYLCGELIRERIADAGMLLRYADKLFVHEIRLASPEIRYVIVVHGKLKGEQKYPVSGSCAYAPIYDEDVSLVFEDGAGSRFVCDVEYEDRPLFDREESLFGLLAEKEELAGDETGLLLYQCERGRSYTCVDKQNVRYAERLWSHSGILEEYRNDLGMKLLQYYYALDAPEELDRFLLRLEPRLMNSRDRAEALRCLILRGMYDTAYEWLGTYGPEKLAPKLIVRLCSRLLEYEEYTENDQMAALTYFAFRKGKYDENVLRYLSGYFIGTVKEMGELWRACDRFDTGCYELSERLLIQMLFTGEYIEDETAILKKYLAGSANEALRDSYLAHFAYENFMHGQELAPYIWKELERKIKNGEEQDVVCELALLGYFVKKDRLDEEEERAVVQFLEDLTEKRGIVMGFIRKFEALYPRIASFADQTFLEYQAETEYPLVLHYMLKSEGRGGDYRTQELKRRYPGIYTRSFTLFCDETLQYYITEKKEQKETLLQSGSLRYQDDSGGEMTGRFQRINRYIEALSRGEADRAGRLLEEYYQDELSAEKLFTLL